MMPAPSPWTPERDAELRRLVDSDLPYSQIAVAMSISFNSTFSKNMVIGRARRLDFPQRPGNNGAMTKRWHEARENGAQRVPLSVFPPPGCCQWIVNDRVPFIFCAHKAPDGLWCEAHRAKVYLPKKAPVSAVVP